MDRIKAYWVGQIKWWCSRSFEWWAKPFTALYVGGAILIMGAKSDELIALKLNEMGDFAAGVFGPVAFLWLILGYIQQGRELKLSSEALQLQADELKASVEQQSIMAIAATRQLQSQQEAFDLQVWKHEREISPDFEFKSFPLKILPDRLVESCVRIKNKGHRVRFVSLSFEEVIDVEGELIFGSLETEDWSEDVKFSFHTPEVLVIGRCFVEYLRVDNRTLKDEFSVLVAPDGTLAIERTAPSVQS